MIEGLRLQIEDMAAEARAAIENWRGRALEAEAMLQIQESELTQLRLRVDDLTDENKRLFDKVMRGKE